MITISGYEIQKKMRHNHNIDTYHALRLKDKRRVLLKIPNSHYTSSENIAILQHEYYLLNKIESPIIIKAYDFLQNPATPALILEHVEGQLLSSYLIENQLEINDFFYLALQLVDIVGELHQRNIIHKEIRPSNIIIDSTNLTLKLVDLSASTRLSEEAFDYVNFNKYEENLSYISPEQTGRLNRPVDYRTDFYSLGITLYEMLTQQLPFQTNDPLELIQCHVAKKPHSVLSIKRNMPKMLAAIIDKLLEKMPEERYSSIFGIKADIETAHKQWRLKINVTDYSLGSNDIRDHLNISRNLYGRDQQINQLINAFNQVSQAAKKMVFIAGYSGVGKTSLVKEVYKPIVEHKGYFIQGKFDQLQRSVPYSAIVGAFQSLVKQVLSEGESRLKELKTQLLNSLGTTGQVVIDVIPEVELIIGSQPPVPPLNPTDTQIRFNLVFQNFVRVFATEHHPLVIFLDDLQWADNSSLNFIENILQDYDTQYLLLIGSYRDNEINANHPLQASINNLSKNKVEFTKLTLQPLQLNNVQQLLQDALSGSAEEIQRLAECVFDKTKGNPFFINEFLKLIYQQNLLTFSYEQGNWTWDLAEIQQQSADDNVINLITSKIHLLTKASQETLKLGSCFGHQFDFKTLLIINGQTVSQIAEQLWQAISANLIYPLEETFKTLGLVGLNEQVIDPNISTLQYRFAHDKIQQATYDLIENQERPNIHLKIGRILLKEEPLKEHDERLFTVLKHFNQSINLIDDIEERQLLAKYNFWAGQKAKLSSAYFAANEYFSAGVEFLDPQTWKKNYSLAFSLYKEYAVCKYLTGDFITAGKYFSELLNYSRNALDNLEIHRLKIEMLSTQGKHTEALELGLAALRNFKIKIPVKPSLIHILMAIYKIKFQIRKTKIADIDLPPMDDLQQKAIVDLMTQLLNSAFITNQQLFVLLTCKNISMSLKYGYTESTSMSIPVYAFIIMHSLNLYDEAISFVTLYQKLKKEYGASDFEGKNQFILGTFIEPYQLPFNACNETVNKAFGLCCDVGDLVYSNYSKLLLVLHSFSTGNGLSVVKKNVASALSFMSRLQISDFITVAKFWDFSIQCLENSQVASPEHITFFKEQLLKGKNKTELSFFYSSLTRLYFLLGEYEEAVKAGELHEYYSDYDKGLISHLDGKLFFALALFHHIPLIPKSKHKPYLKQLRKLKAFINKYASWCPNNYQAYSLLMEGEFARLQHQDESALALYEQTIKTAQVSSQVLIAAIASERAAIHCFDIKLDRFAKSYLSNAHQHFQNWGAITKVHLLEQTYPILILDLHSLSNNSGTTQPVTNTKNVDMLTILKFTQLLSGEIRLDKLLEKLLVIVLEMAEAQQAVLLSKVNEQWIVEAEGNLEKQTIHLNGLAQTSQNYPVSIFKQVQHTQKSIILNDAIQSEITFQDAYIKQKNPRSLLMMPLFCQGYLCRILYLENNSDSSTFTPTHLNSLELIATQAMTALENAKRFYQVTHDLLTGLANKNMLYEFFQIATRQIARTQGTVTLLTLEIDHLKSINKNLGHDAGDKILAHVAKILNSSLHKGDIAARIDGDEFTVMLTNVANKDIPIVINRLFEDLSQPVQIHDKVMHITSSVGISIYPLDGTDIQTLIKHAKSALYKAKEEGGNQFRFYSS